ncbi:hypothetical protein TNIN_199381 [Trichonephila inaurata madagascariensis]|uniref:Uncharacterized protein n=1 Tax=Trichonephila inaurata madagascariensis TaxID=2747483 RepID=A0A8X6YCC0_9ARAC|nr:hypothetical protein TNIN_201391 [Trichonephila inaurata madagascariensis]GFY68799.1 hypothetical protein TNIN_199381 [Trichonephila inaurata madagascariensis]
MSDKDFQVMFELMCEMTKAPGGKLNLEGLKQWFSQAKLIDEEKGLTNAEIESAYAKHAKDKNGILISELKECVAELATQKEKEPKDYMEKLATTSTPQPKREQI